MSTASTTQIEHPDIVHRVLRFLAWFGLVYGLLGLIQASTWLFLIRWIGTVRLLDYPPQFMCRAIIDFSSIWLIAGCIGVLRGKPRARGVLFAWAVFALGIEVIYEGIILRRPLSMSLDTLVYLIDSLLRWSLEQGFVLTLLCVMGLRETLLATIEHDGGAFEVVIDHTPASPVPRSRSRSAFCGDVRRCVAWLGALLGLCAFCHLLVQAFHGNFLYSVPRIDSPWRYHALVAVTGASQLSSAVLLAGSILMILERRAGSRLMVTWAILYLVLAVAGGALYDAMYLYWVATKPRPEPQSTLVIGGIYLFAGLRNCAFAIISLYLLRQPQIAAAEGGIVEADSPASTRVA